MTLKTEIIKVTFKEPSAIMDAVAQCVDDMESADKAVLRWGLIGLHGREALLEVAMVTATGSPKRPSIGSAPVQSPARSVNVAIVIPTGVGAHIGGFIGDAGPIVRSFQAVADAVIVHPNVVNGADFYAGGPQCLYLDGLTMDRFFEGKVRVTRRHQTRIGLLLDRLEANLESRVLNAANAVRAVAGAEMVGYVVCKEKIRSRLIRSDFGHFVGVVENPEVLFRAAEMLHERGAEVIAVLTAICGVSKNDLTRHYMGSGPNPVGSVEALISRAITWKTGLVCAHAPAFTDGLGESSAVIDPRAAAEVASGSGLPCILYGLAQAPRLVQTGGMGVRDLSAIVIPFECAGGPPALSAYRFRIPLVAVRSNRCAVGVAADALGIPTAIAVENYPEAIGFIACRKAGLSWDSVHRPIRALKDLGASEAADFDGTDTG
jgi:hypothetical protein